MKRVVLRSSDGTVPLRPVRAVKPVELRCMGCRHLRAQEDRIGYARYGCDAGRYRVGSGAPRRYSLHELSVPSRDLLYVAEHCTAYEPLEVTP